MLAPSSLIRRLVERELRSRPGRALLAASGVATGVCLICVLGGVSEGVRREVLDGFSALGSQCVIVREAELSRGQKILAAGAHAAGLDERLGEHLRLVTEGVVDVVAEADLAVELRERGLERTLRILATNLAQPRSDRSGAMTGRWFAKREQSGGLNVAIAADGLIRELLSAGWRRGEPLRAGKSLVEIVGVASRRSGVQRRGGLPAADLVIPLATASSAFGLPRLSTGHRRVDRLLFEIAEGIDPETVAREIEARLRAEHRGVESLKVETVARALAERRKADRTLRGLIGLSTGLALLFGAVSIANVMFASLAERRREIAIHRAVGARARVIFTLFLAESSLLSFAGAAAGMATGLLLCAIFALTGLVPVGLSLGSWVTSFLAALGVGIAAGLFPARQAARMEPMQALRS